MNVAWRWFLASGLILTSELTGLVQNVAAGSPETSLTITIHVRNYAEIDPKTLTEAEEVATGIFRKAGLETEWADTVLTAESNQANSPDHPAFTLADIQLSIYPREMSNRIGLANNAMGLAPGTGFDRTIVYVFDSKVEIFFWGLLRAHGGGRMDRPVSKAQILGHAIAHELGHLLLNIQVHSERGIMRGDWGLTEMRDAAYGNLLFTPEQVEVLRADVRRRNSQQETLEVN
jgi:hypothetical protein